MTTKGNAALEDQSSAAQTWVKRPSVTQHSTTFAIPVERERSLWREVGTIALLQCVIFGAGLLVLTHPELLGYVQSCFLRGSVAL